MSFEDDLPNKPLSTRRVTGLEGKKGVSNTYPLFGLPPTGKRTVVIFGLETVDGVKLFGFNGKSWEDLDVAIGDDQDGQSMQDMMDDMVDAATIFIIKNYEVQPELIISERSPEEDVLDAFPESPLKRDGLRNLAANPALEDQDPIFELDRGTRENDRNQEESENKGEVETEKENEVICVSLVRTPLRKSEVPLHFILGFYPEVDRWEVISKHEVSDHGTTMQESDGAVVIDWLTNRYKRENIKMVEDVWNTYE